MPDGCTDARDSPAARHIGGRELAPPDLAAAGRRPLYRQTATIRVRTDGRSPGRVVQQVLAKLEAADAATSQTISEDRSPTP